MNNGTQRPAAQTLKQRFGFMDEDLTSARHDEIMLWLDQHLPDVLAPSYPHIAWTPRNITEVTSDIEQARQRAYGEARRTKFEALLAAPQPERPPARIQSKTWEYPIRNRVNDPIGFVDMRVEVGIPVLFFNEEMGYHVGFRTEEVCFEAKSHIGSLGELFRQIRMYQAHLPQARFIVIGPDERFADTLRAQGIGFVKYEPEA